MKITIILLLVCTYSFAQCQNSTYVTLPEASNLINMTKKQEWDRTHSTSDSILFKCQYENGLLTKDEYQDLLKGLAELAKMKKESMDYIIWQKRKQTFLEGMKKIVGIKDPEPVLKDFFNPNNLKLTNL